MPQVVLIEPQIPPNTGNVARSCAATGSELHLVDPLGFRIDDRQLRRAGLDYWPLVPLHRHGDTQAFLEHRRRRGGRLLALSARAERAYTAIVFRPDDWLMFGCESDGLPEHLQALADERLTIPMLGSVAGRVGAVRSLNLSVAVGVVLFEALRQIGASAPAGGGSSGSVV